MYSFCNTSLLFFTFPTPTLPLLPTTLLSFPHLQLKLPFLECNHCSTNSLERKKRCPNLHLGEFLVLKLLLPFFDLFAEFHVETSIFVRLYRKTLTIGDFLFPNSFNAECCFFCDGERLWTLRCVLDRIV